MQTTNALLQTFLAKKGQFGRATWQRDVKLLKNATCKVVKQTTMTIQAGVDYNNLKKVQMKREMDELPSTPQPLPWGEWALFPYLITHKGETYLRLYPTPNSSIKTIYFKDGEPCEYSDVVHMFLASEKHKGNDSGMPDCITVNLTNMIHLS